MHRPTPVPDLAPDVVLTKAVRSAADRLGLRNRRLAEVRTIDPDSKEGELALLFLRLFRSLDALVGGDEAKARAWLGAENAHLGGVPAERMRRVEGLVDVVQYLDALRGRL